MLRGFSWRSLEVQREWCEGSAGMVWGFSGSSEGQAGPGRWRLWELRPAPAPRGLTAPAAAGPALGRNTPGKGHSSGSWSDFALKLQ